MNSFIGYGVLTLAIIWIAALVPSMGNIFAVEVWVPPILLTLFVLALGVVFLRGNK